MKSHQAVAACINLHKSRSVYVPEDSGDQEIDETEARYEMREALLVLCMSLSKNHRRSGTLVEVQVCHLVVFGRALRHFGHQAR